MRASRRSLLIAASALALVLIAGVVASVGLGAFRTGSFGPSQRGGTSPCGCGVEKVVSPGTIRLCEAAQVTVTIRPACPGSPIHIVLIIDEVYKPGYSEPNDRTKALRDSVKRLELDRHPSTKVGVVWMQRGGARTKVALTNDEGQVLSNLDVPPLSRFEADVQCFDCGYREAVAVLDAGTKDLPRGTDIDEITILAPLGVYTPDAVPGITSGSRMVKGRGVTSITTCFAWTHCDPVLRQAASEARLYLGYGEGNRLASLLESVVKASEITVLRRVLLQDALPADVELDVGSVRPAPDAYDSVRRTLRWQHTGEIAGLYTATYKIRPQRLGTLDLTGPAWVTLWDSHSRMITATLPTRALTVPLECPLATPTPEIPTDTPEPTRTPTATATPSRTPTRNPTPTPTPTRVPSPVYLPILLREECRATRTHTDVALVLDMSTTMRDRTADGQVKLDAALAGAQRFVEAMQLAPDERGRFDRVAIVGFNRTAWIQQPLTNDALALARALAALPAGVEEYTRLDLAFTRGAEALAGPRDADTTAVMVVLTDGLPNRVPLAEDGSQDTTVLRAARAAKDAGITVYTIGVGRVDGPKPDINQALLRAAASRPELFLTTTEAGQLVSIYSDLTRVVPCGGATFWTGRP